MELVFEDGQILAKGQRANLPLHNQRTKSIMDLYEAEYNEDFMKSIISIKNFGDTQVVPQHHVVAAHQTTMLEGNKLVDDTTLIEFIPPDEQSVVAERTLQSGFDTSSAGFTEDHSEGSTYLTSSLDDESDDARPRVPARTRKTLVKRKRNTEAYSSPERKQRNNIKKKMRTLQDLLPNSHKNDDSESMLDEAINYMTNLQLQVQMMTMGNRFVTPSMMLPLGPQYSQMGLAMGMGMQMGAPQFLPGPVLGAGLPGVDNSANMLRFLNHHGPMSLENSAPFTPMERCSPQSVSPSCATLPNQIPNPISLSNLDGETPYTRNNDQKQMAKFSLV